MLLRRIVGILCILLALGWGLPFRASAEAQPGELVDRGIGMYLEGRYQQARDLLLEALKFKQEELGRNRLLGALAYLAFCQIALSETAAAQKSFERLLGLEPAYRLPAGTSPKIVTIFEDVRAKMPKKIEPRPRPEEKPPPGVIPPGKKPEEPRPEKSSSNWWIWAVVGGVLVGAGVTLAVVLSGEDEPTGNAFIDIQVIGP
jgi:tetratricopeptide (TPR) repeat protein